MAKEIDLMSILQDAQHGEPLVIQHKTPPLSLFCVCFDKSLILFNVSIRQVFSRGSDMKRTQS